MLDSFGRMSIAACCADSIECSCCTCCWQAVVYLAAWDVVWACLASLPRCCTCGAAVSAAAVPAAARGGARTAVNCGRRCEAVWLALQQHSGSVPAMQCMAVDVAACVQDCLLQHCMAGNCDQAAKVGAKPASEQCSFDACAFDASWQHHQGKQQASMARCCCTCTGAAIAASQNREFLRPLIYQHLSRPPVVMCTGHVTHCIAAMIALC
jgi:hypothetical protein